MNKLFNPVQEAHDAKNRQVFLCSSKWGFYVYKPATGFKSKFWAAMDNEVLQACWQRQISDSQKFASYLPEEKIDKAQG